MGRSGARWLIEPPTPPGERSPRAALTVDVDPTPWPLAVARGLGAGLLVAVAMLVLWSVLPSFFGWRTEVVLTGSMRPRISPGDLVLAAPVRADELRPGRIVLFRDPAHPGRTLVHRLVRFDADGGLVTKGDANRVEDSTPAAPTAALGLPRLRVPYVGRPVVWLHEHDVPELLLASAVLTGLLGLALAPAPRGGNRTPRHRPVHRVRTATASPERPSFGG